MDILAYPTKQLWNLTNDKKYSSITLSSGALAAFRF